MNYTIKVRIAETKDKNVKGFATITFGNAFKVTNVAIREKQEDGSLYVAMPRYRTKELDESGNNIYKDICNPVTADFRTEFYENILKAYDLVLQGEEKVMECNPDSKGEPEFKVSVTPFEKEGSNIKGLVRVYLDEAFVIGNITLLQGREDVFVAMPSYPTKRVDESGKTIYQDICYPVTKEFRSKLYGEITGIYQQNKAEREAHENVTLSEDKSKDSKTKDEKKEPEDPDKNQTKKSGRKK